MFAAVKVVRPVPPFEVPSVPVTPVDSGRPVALVNTTADGVPSAGVTSVGEVARTIPPEPVTACPSAVCTPVPNEVMPVPPLAIGSVPVTPAVRESWPKDGLAAAPFDRSG